MAKSKAPQEKRLDTLSEETEKRKKALLSQLRRTPIIELACEREGVGRATYYKWRKYDKVFARVADDAIEAGRFRVNDLAESRLIGMMQNDEPWAIKFWLQFNHPKYTTINRVVHEYVLDVDRTSVEERNTAMSAASHMLADIAWKRMPKTTPEQLKERIEAEPPETKQDVEDARRSRNFEDDSETEKDS